MRRAGVNTVRTYTVPDQRFLDLAQQHGLRIMVGVPWADHVAFLDDRQLSRAIRRDVVANVRALASHPAVADAGARQRDPRRRRALARP